MIQEFKKIKNTPFIWLSFLIIAIVPTFSLLFWKLNIFEFRPGDLNKINLLVLSSVHCKITFPILVVVLLKIDYGIQGITRASYLPVKKTSILYHKLMLSITWLLILVIWSLLINSLVSWLMFNDLMILKDFFNQWQAYILIILLGITMENLTFILVILLKNYYTVLIIFMASLGLGYTLQLFGDFYFIFSGIPKYILKSPASKLGLYLNFIVMLLSLIMMIYYTKVMFKNSEKELLNE